MSRPPAPPQPQGRLTDARLGGRIRILETWFDDDPESMEGFDVWISHQRSRPFTEGRWLYFYTIHQDLTLAPGELLSRMRGDTARGIRQAETKDNLSIAFYLEPTRQDLEGFARFYDANPRAPGQRPLELDRLEQARQAGMVNLVTVRDASGTELVRHLLLDHRRSGIIQLFLLPSLLHSTEEREKIKAVARANRWLFYKAMLFYGGRGYRFYDFCGWYGGTEDEKRININYFKEGFRGRIVYGYDTIEPVTLRGRIFLLLKTLKANLLEPGYRRERERRRTMAQRVPEGMQEPTPQAL